jgi:hypothetical protein
MVLIGIFKNMLASRTHVGSDGDSAIRGNGESLVKVQHCPATVRRFLRVRMPAEIALQPTICVVQIGNQ